MSRIKKYKDYINESKDINDDSFLLQLVKAKVIDRQMLNSSDLLNKISSKRDLTIIDMFISFLIDFNDSEESFEDFWNINKNNYVLPLHIKKLNADLVLDKFFILKDKLYFNPITIKQFFDQIQLPIKSVKKGEIILPDKSRNGSITVGRDKDHVKFATKGLDWFQNRKMYKFKDFSEVNEEKKDIWVYNGDFEVTKDMVIDYKMIKDKIPDEVTGDFDCAHVLLKSLKGSPYKVGGHFHCYSNLLTSLEGSPTVVHGNFDCSMNRLTSLEGFSTSVAGYFNCSYNKLSSLEGCLAKVSGKIYCVSNFKNLEIEADFIKSGSFSSQATYWQDLLQYMINRKIDLNKVHSWPDEFIKTLDDQYKNMLKSFKGTRKFNL